eukprot:Skav225456  [mRNA]  locus=scaffold881:11561:12319:+ [translate_table: standard]
MSEDPLWFKLELMGFTRTEQLKSELNRPVHLANLFDTEDECIELVKGIHGMEYVLHEVLADADLLMTWKQDNQVHLERQIRLDRLNCKRYCLRPSMTAQSSDVYSELLGLDVQLQCRVSKSTFRAKLRDPGVSRGDLEAASRAYWLKVLVAFVVEAQLPLVSIASQTADPQLAMEMAFGNRRMKTLRSRARAWKKVANWLEMFRGVSHPRGVVDMLDYMGFLLQEVLLLCWKMLGKCHLQRRLVRTDCGFKQ